MVARAGIMPIATGALDGVGARTIGRQQEPRHPRVTGQPVLNGLGLMDFRVLSDHIEPRLVGGPLAAFEDLEQVAEQRVGLPWSEAGQQRSARQVERPGQVVLRLRPWGHPGQLRPLGHPGRTDVRP